jgi:hypothetical protein
LTVRLLEEIGKWKYYHSRTPHNKYSEIFNISLTNLNITLTRNDGLKSEFCKKIQKLDFSLFKSILFMKSLILLSVFLMATLASLAQTNEQFSRTTFSKDVSFIRTDTTHGSQTTVVEYPKFLVIIELPMLDDGANRSTNLVEDIPKAERFLNYLRKEYNDKPIKYVMSSHWHLHSLSGITPFFHQGARLVVAKTNWEYSVKNGLFGTSDTKVLEKQVVQVTKDTTILSETNFPISVLFLDNTYTNKPTKDYLFFYMPKNKCIHASCMCAVPEIDFKQRPEFFYNDRVTDLEKAIKARNLEVENIFKLTAEYDKDQKTYKMPAINNLYFGEFKQRGKPLASIINKLASYEMDYLEARKDSILHYLITKKISPTIVNSTVYACIKSKDFPRAIQWAQILNLYQIGEVNFMDTLGEAYYYAGNLIMAQRISNQLAVLDKKLSNQMKVWEQAKMSNN